MVPNTKLAELSKNVGKRCKGHECTIAGYTGKIGTILEVKGDDLRGYRYTIRYKDIDLPYDTLYMPVFLVSVLDD